MDAPGGGGGGFNKDRMKPKSDGENGGMMFGDMGSFGHSNGAEGNAGTQETGIIEKLLVSNKREREK